jgi:amino acid transporter
MAQSTVSGTTLKPEGLRRELSVWEAIGVSLALMAPSMAVNINPQGTAGTVGRAVPLAFALATAGVLLIAYTFVRLCQRFHHAGSVYGFVGATLGPRTGVVAGWALVGTYVFYGVVTSTAAGIFGAAALDSLGIWTNQPPWAGFAVAAIALIGVLALAVVKVRGGTRLLLTIEAATVTLILVVSVIVLVKLVSGTAPGGHGVDWSVFTVAPGTDASAVFLGVVFGFLSFAGFEAAATLGEEAREPRRSIPRAILGTAIFGGVYFVFVTAVEVMGFGADDAGVAAFTKSPSLLGDLGGSYVAAWIGDLITIGAAISAFGCALACAVSAARLVFALSRDGLLPAGLAAVSGSRGTPARATLLVVIGMYMIIALALFGFHAAPMDVFVASGTIGTLILLVAYALATVGAARLLFFSGNRQVAIWEVVIPLLALVLIGYTLYRNVVPYPEGGAGIYPAVSAAWIVLGVLLVLFRRRAAAAAGERLTASEGLART